MCQINDYIGVRIPTVGEIVDCEDAYYDLVSLLTAMPIDMMVQLDDAGIDFTTIDEWSLFLLLFDTLKTRDTSLILGTLDLHTFCRMVNPQNGQTVLVGRQDGVEVRIDRAIHAQIAETLRTIHHLTPNRRTPANAEAKEYMLSRARKKLRRQRMRPTESQLEGLIVAMVSTEQFHYDFTSVRTLSIYQFNESVRQIVKKVDYDNRMYGVYAGTVNAKDLSQDDLNWLTHK